jgi:acyl carrier protein
MHITAKIKNFIIDNFLFGDATGLNHDTSFLEESIVDSTGILELVSYLENEFSFVIKDEELIPENLDSIHKVTEFIKRKKGLFRLENALAEEEQKNEHFDEAEEVELQPAIAGI